MSWQDINFAAGFRWEHYVFDLFGEDLALGGDDVEGDGHGDYSLLS